MRVTTDARILHPSVCGLICLCLIDCEEKFDAKVMDCPKLEVKLPDWLLDHWKQQTKPFATCEDRMRFVIELSRLNASKDGGPFGAAVFEAHSGLLIAPGINIVAQSSCSIAHAEIIALMFAQRILNDFTLHLNSGKHYQLVSSTEPCIQCFGALIWSGISSLVCGAKTSDAEAIGFDEGPKPGNWIEELQKRGIEVVPGVLRTEAVKVLEEYKANGGVIYNARP